MCLFCLLSWQPLLAVPELCCGLRASDKFHWKLCLFEVITLGRQASVVSWVLSHQNWNHCLLLYSFGAWSYSYLTITSLKIKNVALSSNKSNHLCFFLQLLQQFINVLHHRSSLLLRRFSCLDYPDFRCLDVEGTQIDFLDIRLLSLHHSWNWSNFRSV